MIPKKIHYCWFGKNKKSKLAEKCIASWKKYCPDYEIIEWNEDNFDVSLNDYTKFTSSNNLYAYLSDYVRLWAVEKYGGIYFDIDVELIKSPEELRKYEAYFGFESDEFVNTGIGFGAQAHHESVKAMLIGYEKRTTAELEEDYRNSPFLTGSPRMNTRALVNLGLKQNGSEQTVNNAKIFSAEYFCPFNDLTGEFKKTENTVSIHWYSKSAMGKKGQIKSKFSRIIHRALKKGVK